MHSFLGRSLSGAFLSFGIALADLYLKRVVASSFFIGESVEVIPGFFALTFIRNPGVAFGLFSNWDSSIRLPLLLAFSTLALGFIIYLISALVDVTIHADPYTEGSPDPFHHLMERGLPSATPPWPGAPIIFPVNVR